MFDVELLTVQATQADRWAEIVSEKVECLCPSVEACAQCHAILQCEDNGMKKQARMIQVDDLPLFSGTAPHATLEVFKPSEYQTADYLPGFEPEPITFGGQNADRVCATLFVVDR
jgi:hypothetical protein